MIRELATKRLTSPSRARLYTDTKLSKRISTNSNSSNVVASLEALKLTFEEEDSEIEISGPFPRSLQSEPSRTVARSGVKETLENAVVQQANVKPIHSFFRPYMQHPSNSYDPPCLSLGVSPPPTLKLGHKTSPSTVTENLDSVNTLATSNTVTDTPVITPPGAKLSVYSYKNYKPSPTVVYTQHEEEANDLIGGLKAGPVALDIEWRLYFLPRIAGTSYTLVERRAAVVQVADSSGFILVIQIYNMSRFPIKLQTLIENHEIPKIGVNILNDGNKLFRDYGILAQNLVELGALALLADPAGSQKRSTSKRKVISLAKLVQWYCGTELEKGEARTSNWELKLDKRQIDYAANDVHSSMVVYQKLCNIAQLDTISLTDKKPIFTSNVQWPTSTKYQQSNQNNTMQVRGQHIRAYQLWHHHNMTLDNMLAKLNLKRRSTVISYVIGALQANPSLPYSLPALIKFVQMDIGSWTYHREWIIYTWNQNLE